MKRLRFAVELVFTASLGTGAFVGESVAGENSGARAFLSWSSDPASTALDSVPDENGEAVLYLHIEGSQDVLHMTNEILWSAYIPNGASLIWPDPRDGYVDGCGITDGNPSRRGQVEFEAPPVRDFCVAMKFRVAPPTALIDGRFRPGFVRLEDSEGRSDILEIDEAGVTLNGGQEAGFSFLVTEVTGNAPTAGGTADTISVAGHGFEGGTVVTLRSEISQRSLSGRILSRNWNSLTAEFAPGPGDGGIWRAIVQNPAGIGFTDSSLTIEVLPPSGESRTWRVPEDFARVRDALDAAAPGDTVEVGPGIFEGDHAWIVDKDRVVLRGAGADKTVIRATNDSVLGIVRSDQVQVSGIAFVVDNSGTPLRVPAHLFDAGCLVERCVFVFSNCRVCAFITQPQELRFVGNTLIRRGDGSNLFARVTPSTQSGEDLVNRVEIRQILLLGFDASFDCEALVSIEADCNWDSGVWLAWFETMSEAEPRLEAPDSLDFRPLDGSLALPGNNSCGLLIGALGR